MKARKIPLRMCLACKANKPKKELIRVVMQEENKFEIDFTGKINGRGAYVCNNSECVEKTIKQKILHKSFKTNIPQNVYETLKEKFVEQNAEQD